MGIKHYLTTTFLVSALLISSFSSVFAETQNYIFTKADTPLPDGAVHQCSYFNDMNEHWSKDSVCFVRENGLMSGVYQDQFRPQETFSRAMAITVLYRMAGSPSIDTETHSGFTDVNHNDYYIEAVIWAAENGIVNSNTTSQFYPSSPITREELALLFYNFAMYMGYDVSSGNDRKILQSFGDNEAISPWSARAIAYMANIGVMSGNADSDIQPGNSIIRAEVAAMIERFLAYEHSFTNVEHPTDAAITVSTDSAITTKPGIITESAVDSL